MRFSNFYAGLEDEDVRSKLTNSAIHSGRGIGVYVTRTSDVILDGNVVWYQHVGGIFVQKSNNTKILNNVVAGMGTKYWVSDTRLSEIAAFLLCNHDTRRCPGLEVRNNIGAGGERAGFVLPAACDSSISPYSNNSAHTFEHSAIVQPNGRCDKKDIQHFGNFDAYKSMREGIIAHQNFGEQFVVDNYVSYDNGVGVSIVLTRKEYNFITVKNSVFYGESSVLPKDDEDHCVGVYGFYSVAATDVGKNFPEIRKTYHPLDLVKGDSSWFTEGNHENLVFKNWLSGKRQHCSSGGEKAMQRVVFMTPNNTDHVPVDRFTKTTFDNVVNAAMTYMTPPDPEWAIIKDCGQFPCTGPLNCVLKFDENQFIGTNKPTVQDEYFTIVPDNPEAVEAIEGCKKEPDMKAYICKNKRIGQLVLESLDSDKYTRMLYPIHFYGIDRMTQKRNSFNNTMNAFQDECWTGHYACINRLQRFPGLVEFDKKYEVYFTGTTPANSRYVLQGASDGDYVIAQIDFSQSVLYHVYVQINRGKQTKVEAQRYNRTLTKPNPLDITVCGSSRFEQAYYIYEFAIQKNCTVYLKAQDHLINLMRLNFKINDFFEDEFVNNMAYFLGITTDQIRIVGVWEGSVNVESQITCEENSPQCLKEVEELADKINAGYESGSLSRALKVEILSQTTNVIRSDGTLIQTTGDYKKKEIHFMVYVLLSISIIAVIISVTYAVFKMLKMGKAYNEVRNDESVVSEKMDKDFGDKKDNQIVISENEEAKS